jgi:hypothetical protein
MMWNCIARLARAMPFVGCRNYRRQPRLLPFEAPGGADMPLAALADFAPAAY